MEKCYGCKSKITKKNTRHYKGFCCTNTYHYHLEKFGKDSTDAHTEESKEIVGKLNKLIK
jgi:hypothetical protein